MNPQKILYKTIAIIIGIAALVLLWEIVVRLTAVPRYILPGPKAVFTCLWQERFFLLEHGWITAQETIIGMILGVIMGGITAMLMVALPPLRRVIYPAMIISQALPVFALAPLLVLWLGYGIASKIAMTVLILYFPVCATLYHGLRSINPEWRMLADTMNAKPFYRFWYLDLPAALPVFAAGLNIAAATAPIGAIIGEWVGASGGLGYVMLQSNARMKTELMFAALLVLAMLALALFGGAALTGRYLTRWHNQ